MQTKVKRTHLCIIKLQNFALLTCYKNITILQLKIQIQKTNTEQMNNDIYTIIFIIHVNNNYIYRLVYAQGTKCNITYWISYFLCVETIFGDRAKNWYKFTSKRKEKFSGIRRCALTTRLKIPGGERTSETNR